MTNYCKSLPFSRGRSFWTTQPEACGASGDNCGQECGRPGLQLAPAHGGSSFVTADWLRSLVINILYTDGRKNDTKCGYVPGTQGGHWSESFRKDGQKIGTLVRFVPTSTSIRDAVALIKARIVADLNRLVVMQIASSVNVVANYIGGNRLHIDIIITNQSGESARVGLTGARLKNAWVWT